MLQLVGGKNGEGYLHALSRTWDLFASLKQMPVKSALARVRKRISFEFFKDQFDQIINEYECHRRTWRGPRVYASDGDRYELPRSEDLLSHDYRGYPFSKTQETHYLHMYAVHCYDVLSGVTKDFRYSTRNDEFQLALEAATAVESRCVTLYDRLFFSADLVRAHRCSQSYFIARLKTGIRGVPKEINDFAKGCRRNDRLEVDGELIELVKIKNPKTGKNLVFATNLARSRFKNKEIASLYALRWEVETNNRDISSTIKMEQWHSRFKNGILQEIYAALWLMNQARIQMAGKLKQSCSLAELSDYKKANFKLVSDIILDNLKDLVRNRIGRVHHKLSFIITKSQERRKRRSRSYPRQLRRRPKVYLLASSAPRATK